VDAVLAKALAKDPVERYASAGALVADARRALGISSGEIVRPDFGRRRRRWPLVVVGVAVVVGLVSAVALMARGGSAAVVAAPDSVAVIDPVSGKITDDIPVGRGPDAIAAGDGAVWVGNFDDNTVSHIDTPSGKVVRTIPLRATPTGLAVSADLVWVATGDMQRGDTYKIVATYDRVTKTIHLPTNPGFAHFSGRRAVAARGQEVWVASLDGTALSIEPATMAHGVPVTVGTSVNAGVAVGFGSAWVGVSDVNVVSRIDPATNAVLKTIPVRDGPSNLAIGRDAVWVSNRRDDSVTRIDPVRNAVVTTIPVGRHPQGIVVLGGFVFVANSDSGTISRIDPRTNTVDRTITVGNRPTGLVSAAGSLWVTVQGVSVPWLAGDGARDDVLRVELTRPDFDSTDPAFAYSVTSWQMLAATCARLVTYPDAPAPEGSRPVAEVAREIPVPTDGGRTYAFRIRPGFRFSPPSNEPVTAETFEKAIERTLSPAMRSPIDAGYMSGIVGLDAYAAGKARHIAGVTARGDTLTIRLRSPDPTLPDKLSMPFFCAVPLNTPLDARGVAPLAGAGPYYLASYAAGRSAVLLRNPNYRGSRPHRMAEIDYTFDVSPRQSVADVIAGKADYVVGGEDSPAMAPLERRFGSSSAAARAGRQQYFVSTFPGINAFALNTSRPLFADARMRRAVNYAIDRRALVRIASTPPTGPVHPTDQYLPPSVTGFRDADIYPFEPDLATARRLAGPGPHGKAILFTCDTGICPRIAHAIQNDLRKIGIDVEIDSMPLGAVLEAQATRGARYDIGMDAGWSPDFLDPAGMFTYMLDGRSIGPTGNSNLSYYDDPAFNRKLDAASRMTGPARYRAFAALDIDVTRHAAPMVAWSDHTYGDFFSARVGCQVYVPMFGMDLGALCRRQT
jgi:peptide/nickel transport system substrate-binding protein